MSVKKSNVVNLTGGVTTKDGRTLYGMDAELYLKMQAKEDPEWEKKIAEWIETVLEKPLESKDLSIALKSGIVLIRLVNKFRPGIVPKFNDGATIHPLMEVENINLYLKACWRLGVPSSDLFSVADLHMARGMPAVLQNLASLSRIAKNSLGWQGEIIGPNVSTNSSNPTKHWDVVIPGKVNVIDLVDDGGESLIEVRQRLQLAQAHAEELQKQLNDLKTENEKLKLFGSAAPQQGAPEGEAAGAGSASSLQQLFERYKKDMAAKNSLLKELDEQCTQLEQRCKELRLDNESLRRAANSASNQANSAAQELRSELDLVKQESTQQKARFEDQIEELKKVRDALVSENSRLKASSTDSRKDNAAQIAKLEEEWQGKLKREVAKTQAQLRALQEHNQELEACVEEMRTENANLRKQANDAESDRAVAVAQSQALKRELDQTKSDLASALAASERPESVEIPFEKVAEIESQWKQKLEEKEQRYSSQFSALEADLKALESQLHGLQEENSNLKEKPVQMTVSPAEQAAAAAARAAAERASRNEEAARMELERIRQEYGSKVEGLLQQQARLRDEANELSAERDRLVASLKRQQDAAQAEAASLKGEIEQLKKKYTSEIDILNDELKNVEEKMEQLRQEKMALEQRQAEASDAQFDASAAEEKFRQREEELQKEIDALKDDAEQTRTQMARRTREIDGVNMSLQRQLLSLDKELRSAKNEAEEKLASSSAQIRSLEEQLAEAEKREANNSKKFEQQIEEMKHEQELLSRSNQDLLSTNEQLKKELEGLRATLATAAMTPTSGSNLTPAQKRRATTLSQPINPEMIMAAAAASEQQPVAASPRTTNSERMSLMLPSSPASLSPVGRSASPSIVELVQHNKRGSHERQHSGPDSLSALSRQVTRKNVTTKMDSSLMNIKAQLESSSGPGSPSGSEPASPQQQHQNQNQAQQQMFYEKEIDDNLLLFCKESLDVIIQGSGNVVYDDMSQINQLFKFDTGRRLFAFLLQYFAQRKEQQLQPEGFEVLLFLYNSCLNELAAAETPDWNTLSILMDTSALFYQQPSGSGTRNNKEFMRDILRTHFIWQNANYWESNFWPTFTAEYRATFGASGDAASVDPSKARQFIQSKKQREWVMEHLREFCLNMIFWGMTKDQCRAFVQNISNYVGLADEHQQDILAKVEKSQQQPDAKSSSPSQSSSSSSKSPKSPREKKKSRWF